MEKGGFGRAGFRREQSVRRTWVVDFDRRELRVSLDRSHPPIALEILGARRECTGAYRIANISRSGMFLEAFKDLGLDPGAMLEFSLKLEHGDEITGLAGVRWVRRENSGPYLPRGFGIKVTAFHDHGERRYHEVLEGCLVGLKLTDLMDANVVTLSPECTVLEAAQALQKAKGGSAVVISPQGLVLGLFRRGTLVDLISSSNFLGQKIGDHLSPVMHVLTTDSSAEEAYVAMRSGGIEYIPVLEDGLIVGLLSTRDLVRYWAEYMDLQASRLAHSYERAVSVMAHDLRTPLSLIRTTNLLLHSGELSLEEYGRLAFPEVIDSSCELMLGLIDDILDAASLRSGSVRLNLADVDLPELFKKVARAFAPTLAARRVRLTLFTEPGLTNIQADGRLIEQVLNNLLSNALKFSPEGTEIVLGAKSQHSQIEILVKDQGPGIPPEEQKSLFREYTAVSPKALRGEKGTGLGLSIVKRLVAVHGGSVNVTSSVGSGATFHVYLPIASLQ